MHFNLVIVHELFKSTVVFFILCSFIAKTPQPRGSFSEQLKQASDIVFNDRLNNFSTRRHGSQFDRKI